MYINLLLKQKEISNLIQTLKVIKSTTVMVSKKNFI